MPLSPHAVAFAMSVTLTANGQELCNGAVKEDVATLRSWAGRDNDRTTLYGADLTIRVA